MKKGGGGGREIDTQGLDISKSYRYTAPVKPERISREHGRKRLLRHHDGLLLVYHVYKVYSSHTAADFGRRTELMSD